MLSFFSPWDSFFLFETLERLENWDLGLLCLTYTINSVDEGIVTAVAHSQPMATKEDYVDVSVAEKDEGKFVSVSSRTKMESLFFFGTTIFWVLA